MPQMSPMYWTMTYTTMLMLLILMSASTYFFLSPKKSKNSIKMDNPQVNWTW
uniref:ATPase subunit 8 n=1 Tax=Arbanatus sp. TaxID=2931282 RepID=A0A8T9ZY68_9HEMI|nr:ATPase subunit 8 [Arbanatus sp.]